MAKVKCPGCELFFDKDKVECIHVKNRYWHKACYDSQQQKMSKEELDLKSLSDYIMKLFGVDYINARVKKQMKDMCEQYNYTYTGILKSLVYFYEVKKNSTEKANGGIGIVPFIYDEARDYFFAIYIAQEKNKDKDASKFVKKGKVITIKPPQRNIKPIKLIDLDKIEEELTYNGE